MYDPTEKKRNSFIVKVSPHCFQSSTILFLQLKPKHPSKWRYELMEAIDEIETTRVS